MIKQSYLSYIKSRTDCNPFTKDNYLPLITAPMSSVINEFNYKLFTDNNIQVCLPRTIENWFWEENVFIAMSLNDFVDEFLKKTLSFIGKRYVCIDTANGNLKVLHDAIIAAKKIHGNNIIIMSGNVASVDAFIELAKTDCDYIRVGIGGSIGCTTTRNTGIGQEDLEKLIHACKFHVTNKKVDVKIVADGISTYIKQCEFKYGFNDNGYAAINKLLYSGADLIMVGTLFAHCVESATNKYIKVNDNYHSISQNEAIDDFPSLDLYGKHYGMSTTHAQSFYNDQIKPSEGSIVYIPIKYSLKQWVYGCESQDNYPYLSGYINSLKSAMSYTNSLTLNNFKQFSL